MVRKSLPPSTEKSFGPDTGKPKSDKVVAPITSDAQPSSRHQPIIGGGPMQKRIPPKESHYTELTRDRAEKLATLRRGWFDEFTWASIGGLTASLPSTVHSYVEVRPLPIFSLSLPQATDFGVTLIFFTMTIVALLSRKRGMTSMRYLESHFGPDPMLPPKRRLFSLFTPKKSLPPSTS
jgi:hypothetical protein